MRVHHYAFGAVLVLTLVVGGGAMAWRTLADPQRVRQQAQERVRAKWNRELEIGTLEVRLTPRPTIDAHDVRIEGMGAAGHVTATLQLWPLLFGHVRASHILAEGGRFDDPRGGAPWTVDRASLDSDFDWRGVTIDANVSRNGQLAHVRGRFADLSRIGHRGEKTRGKVDVEWGETSVSADGEFRLDGWRGNTLRTVLHTKSLDDVFAFVGVDRDRTAPLEISADVRDDGKTITLDDIHLRLGKLHATGSGTVQTGGDKPVVDAKLAADHLDWKQALVDMGHAPTPKEASEFIFRDKKLAWHAFEALRGLRGKVEAKAQTVKLGNGIELQNPTGSFTFEGDRVRLDLFRTRMLGGTAEGSIRFDGTRKAIRFEGRGENLSLQRWFHERGRDHHFTGGPMVVNAAIDMRGETWRDLASSVTGPFSVRMGPGVYASQKAGDWEALMAAFSKKDSNGEIDFECAAATLDFHDGVAQGDSIVGARSTMSRLLTSGVIDMKKEHLDLRGRIVPNTSHVGLAAIAGDVQIEGPLRKMHVRLDPAKKGETIAKGIAAIATAGISVLATSAAHKKQGDPCATAAQRHADVERRAGL